MRIENRHAREAAFVDHARDGLRREEIVAALAAAVLPRARNERENQFGREGVPLRERVEEEHRRDERGERLRAQEKRVRDVLRLVD
jgi:hypothetical protein